MSLLIYLHGKTDNAYIKNEIVNQIEEHPEHLLSVSPIRKKTLESMFEVKTKTVYHGEIELDIAIINEYVNKTQDQMKEIIATMLYKICKEIENVTKLQCYGGIEKKLRYESEDKEKIEKINIVTTQIKNNLNYLIEGLNNCSNREDTHSFMDKFLMYIKLDDKINSEIGDKKPYKQKLKI